MKMLFAVLCLGILLTACDEGRAPQAQIPSSNTAFQVTLLFEADGCKVYRFYDSYYYRYFARCGETTAVSSSWSCGKGCTQHDMTVTAQTKKACP